ncbi:MAG: hypothetical protein HF962_04635 [Sulfurovum sp.]|nr:hypothetical protein [Sulfurovum sp.]
MQNYTLMTDEELIKAMAKHYEKARLSLDMTEEEVSQKGVVSKDAIHRFKNGKNINLKNFLAILRAVNRLDALALLFPPAETFSPLAQKNTSTKKRVFKKRKTVSKSSSFVWGEDA